MGMVVYWPLTGLCLLEYGYGGMLTADRSVLVRIWVLCYMTTDQSVFVRVWVRWHADRWPVWPQPPPLGRHGLQEKHWQWDEVYQVNDYVNWKIVHSYEHFRNWLPPSPLTYGKRSKAFSLRKLASKYSHIFLSDLVTRHFFNWRDLTTIVFRSLFAKTRFP